MDFIRKRFFELLNGPGHPGQDAQDGEFGPVKNMGIFDNILWKS